LHFHTSTGGSNEASEGQPLIAERDAHPRRAAPRHQHQDHRAETRWSLFAARQVNGKPRYQKLTPEVTWVSLGDTNKVRVAKAEALALDLIERIATEPDGDEPTGPDLVLGGLITGTRRWLHGRTARYRNGMLTSVKRVRDVLGADLAVRDLKPSTCSGTWHTAPACSSRATATSCRCRS